MKSLKASDRGLKVIDAYRKRKSWNKTATKWADDAQVGQRTLRRFWAKEPIREDNFQAICRAVGIEDYKDIANSHDLSTKSPQGKLYIHRPPLEELCFAEILKTGALIRIKAPRKMGKTELMHQIFKHVAHYNYAFVPLNLLQIQTSTLTNLDILLRELCGKVSRRLKLENQVSEFWDPDLSSNDNCTTYLEDYILTMLDTPLVLGFDNVDCIFQYPHVAQDFLRLLRSWHDEAQSYPPLKKLRLIVSHSTEVYIPLDVCRSPFNVGFPIELPEFIAEQVLSLSQQYSLDWQPSQVEKLMTMVGGHPYLIQQAFEALAKHPNLCLDELLETALTDSGIYHNHLRALWEYLQEAPKLSTAMRKVVASDQAVQLSSEEAFKLHSLGLALWKGQDITSRNQLYRLYFRSYL